MTTVIGRESGKHAGHLLQTDALYLLACELTLANRTTCCSRFQGAAHAAIMYTFKAAAEGMCTGLLQAHTCDLYVLVASLYNVITTTTI